eukprot:754898-Hanusia_phi.AAC.8
MPDNPRQPSLPPARETGYLLDDQGPSIMNVGLTATKDKLQGTLTSAIRLEQGKNRSTQTIWNLPSHLSETPRMPWQIPSSQLPEQAASYMRLVGAVDQ